ncbi:hypothetical protein ZTR_09056 [Talaromyces verruculosus]|nr:hypothetical protein ZTR_09056 [Talaromyces verruculosus]
MEEAILRRARSAVIGGFLSVAVRGSGFILVEATSVTPEGRITPEDLGPWYDSQIEPLRQAIEFMHSQNQIIGVQIAQAGRKASTVAPWLSMGDTALEKNGGHDIEDLKKAWVDAVKRTVKAGADFVEIHAAHGYLLSSFMSPLSNNRTDEYGGSFENRIWLTLEIAQLTREVVGPNCPVFLGISATAHLENWSIPGSCSVGVAVRIYRINFYSRMPVLLNSQTAGQILV